MLKLPEERRRWGESTYRKGTRKGYYFYSPQSSTVIKSKMAATTILRTRTRFRPPKIHCRLTLCKISLWQCISSLTRLKDHLALLSLRSRRLEVAGERENGRARGRHARGLGWPLLFKYVRRKKVWYPQYEMLKFNDELSVWALYRLQMISPPETGNTYNRTSGAPLRYTRRSRRTRGSGRPRRSGFTSFSLQSETTRFRDWKTVVGVTCWMITNFIHIIVSCKVSRTEFRRLDKLLIYWDHC